MATVVQQGIGCALFALTWLVLLKDRWKWWPFGRAVSAMTLSAMFVAASVLTPDEAYKAINLPTLALLTGCMIVSAHMEKQGIYDLLSKALTSKGTPLGFLIRVCFVTGLTAALLTNDTVCIILTPLVLRACMVRKLHPAPYLLAVATSSNIGSACSPIGNPQNMIIALLGSVYFSNFLASILVAAVVGTAINCAWIAFVYRAQVIGKVGNGGEKVVEHYEPTVAQLAALGLLNVDGADATVADVAAKAGSEGAPAAGKGDVENNDAAPQRQQAADPTSALSPPATHAESETASLSPVIKVSDDTEVRVAASPAAPPSSATSQWQPISKWRRYTILFLLAVLPLCLILGDRWIGLSWIAVLAASILCIVDGGPPEPVLSRVDGNLLLFFSGLFVCVAGFNATGVPQSAWDALSSAVSMQTGSGLLLFTVIVLIGSNTVSNVPLTLMLAPSITAMSDAKLAWILLAWTSTVAGNLTLLGSVANLIVAERCKDVYPLTFTEYLRVGLPSTLVMCVLGVPLVWACGKTQV